MFVAVLIRRGRSENARRLVSGPQTVPGRVYIRVSSEANVDVTPTAVPENGLCDRLAFCCTSWNASRAISDVFITPN